MVMESTPPAGSASPMHVHGREDEVFRLVEGSATLYLGDERFILGAGGVAFLPREVPHAYRITADAHMLTLATPAGLEGFFRAAGHDLSQPKPADWALTPETLTQALVAHGGRIVGPPPEA